VTQTILAHGKNAIEVHVHRGVCVRVMVPKGADEAAIKALTAAATSSAELLDSFLGALQAIMEENET
jgi:hypothetical protein